MNISSINNNYKLEAGVNDAAVETLKLLLMQYGTEKIDKTTLSLSDRTLQFVTPSEPQQINLFLNDTFILTLNNTFEKTLRSYYDYFKKYGANFTEKTEEIYWLDIVLINCAPITSEPDLLWAKDVCDYYRLTRNYLTHGKITKQCLELFDKLSTSNIPEKYLDYYSKPHKFDSLDYNDYKLFSRLTKDISRWICTNPIHNYDKMIADVPINHFKQVYNDRERLIAKIKNYFQKEWGITDINILKQLTDKVLDNLAC